MCLIEVACTGDFEKERADMVNRLTKCASDQADLHQLEWENRKRADEIWELQKVTSGVKDLTKCKSQ